MFYLIDRRERFLGRPFDSAAAASHAMESEPRAVALIDEHGLVLRVRAGVMGQWSVQAADRRNVRTRDRRGLPQLPFTGGSEGRGWRFSSRYRSMACGAARGAYEYRLATPEDRVRTARNMLNGAQRKVGRAPGMLPASADVPPQLRKTFDRLADTLARPVEMVALGIEHANAMLALQDDTARMLRTSKG